MSTEGIRDRAPGFHEATVTFRSIVEEQPGDRLKDLFDVAWPAYRRWFLRDGELARPSYARCLRALRTYVPELVPVYEKLVGTVGGGDLEARFLSLWEPTPFFSACSIAAVPGADRGIVRNYDYVPALCETTLLASQLAGRRTLAMSDCLWGVLDGVNEDGLAVALAFGGRRVVGRGFAITLLLRYLLEMCATVEQAIEAARIVPVNLAYNVVVADAEGDAAFLQIAPDHEPVLSRDVLFAGNRQGKTEWAEHAVMTETVAREEAIAAALVSGPGREELERAFLSEPIYRPHLRHTWGTVYTASYSCRDRTVRLLWPDESWELSLAAPYEEERTRRMVMTMPPVLERTFEPPHTPDVIFA
ncbi:MAG: C45 family autoproteolytic acyltransferase/hydrolase [Gaiella sp.]